MAVGISIRERDLASNLLIALEFLQGIDSGSYLSHLIVRALTVTLCILGDTPTVKLLNFVDHYLLLLRADMIGVMHTNVLLVHADRLCDDWRGLHIVVVCAWYLHGRVLVVGLAGGKLTVLRHANRVLVERGVHEEFGVFDSN